MGIRYPGFLNLDEGSGIEKFASGILYKLPDLQYYPGSTSKNLIILTQKIVFKLSDPEFFTHPGS
jgi:hypothetical protein